MSRVTWTKQAAAVPTVGSMDLAVFPGPIRGEADMLGQMHPSAGGGGWVGHVTGRCGETILLAAKESGGKLVLVGAYGATRDQKRIRREEEG